MDYFFKNYVIFTGYVPTDIYPVQYGAEQCRESYTFGPCIRRNYILHYIYSGKGVLNINSKEYEVLPGQIFLIKPNQLAAYSADAENPWLYRWIEFNGSLAENIVSMFDNDSPVLTDCSNHLLGEKMKLFVDEGDVPFEHIMEKLWSFIGAMTQTFKNHQKMQFQTYARMADEYIKSNIHQKITVNDVADYLKINRSYLSRLFKQYKNIGLQQYIISLKMNTAAHCLRNTDISVSEAAQSVGYTDYHVFNKIFKKHFHLPPSAWRKKLTGEQYVTKEK